jgi:hypothetical protein
MIPEKLEEKEDKKISMKYIMQFYKPSYLATWGVIASIIASA